MKGCTDRRKPGILYGKEEEDKLGIEGEDLRRCLLFEYLHKIM